ncbi:hypothetical protein E3G67_003697 [Mycobacteroides abscessus]|nr:hypothetical protein [Mycobacteroides abscessus]
MEHSLVFGYTTLSRLNPAFFKCILQTLQRIVFDLHLKIKRQEYASDILFALAHCRGQHFMLTAERLTLQVNLFEFDPTCAKSRYSPC